MLSVLKPYSSIILINSVSALKSESSPNDKAMAFSGTKFTLNAYPNPSPSYFNLTISGAGKEPFLVRIMDMSGNLVETRSCLPGKTLQFGDNLKPGAYIIEALQGTKKAQQKVIKLG